MSDTSTPAPTTHHSPGGGSSTGSGLSKRLGPLPVWGWVVVIIGGIIIWRIIKSHQAASAAAGTPSGTIPGANNAANTFGTQGFSLSPAGQIVDNATGDILGSIGNGTNGTATSGTGTLTAGQWFSNAQQALFNLGYDSTAVDQALQDYASGGTLPQNEYGIIEAAIRLTGNPPTGIALPQLQPPAPPPPPPPTQPTPPQQQGPGGPPPQTTLPTGAAPNLPSALISAMQANGEFLVQTVYQPVTQTWLYLTNKGGVYTQGGAGFFGSLFDLTPATFQGRTAQSIVPLANGGYTVVDTRGETYTFGPPGSGAYAGAGGGYTS